MHMPESAKYCTTAPFLFVHIASLHLLEPWRHMQLVRTALKPYCETSQEIITSYYARTGCSGRMFLFELKAFCWGSSQWKITSELLPLLLFNRFGMNLAR